MIRRKPWTKMFVVALTMFFSLAFVFDASGAFEVNAKTSKSAEYVTTDYDTNKAIEMDLRSVIEEVIINATQQINVDIPGEHIAIGTTEMSMESGEEITINVSYSPSSADLDVGILQPDESFRYVKGSDGSVNHTFSISERGIYKLQIRNNSSKTVTVTGFITY